MSIFITSFLILFLELALIRFLAGYIYYLGYFSNIVLIASFFGMGLGFMLAHKGNVLIRWFPPTLLLLMILARISALAINLNSPSLIFFRSDLSANSKTISPTLLIPILFLGISGIFTTITSKLGSLFKEVKEPLAGYTADALGSITGIGVFSLFSALSLPPVMWFGFTALLFFYLFHKVLRPYILLNIIILIAITLAAIDSPSVYTRWSPYYKLTVYGAPDATYTLFANSINHQSFLPIVGAPFYSLVYDRYFPNSPPRNVLIIGAGTGEDVDAAEHAGVSSIDAVEIDPVILSIGKDLHPDQPYNDPRVRTIINDGRAYLEHTSKRYDLIVYALTDSLASHATTGEIRLESYLFTREAFQQVKNHLTPNGWFIAYNDYRFGWLINRMDAMLTQTFGKPPKEIAWNQTGRMFAVQQSGPVASTTFNASEPLPTDDWPFFYLKTRSIPTFYLTMLGILIALSVIITGLVLGKVFQKELLNLRRFAIFFLLGSAFSLVETKSIAQLSLLFGSTWIVNSIAFGGILFCVFLACLVRSHNRAQHGSVGVFVLLLIALVVQYLVPPTIFLVASIPIRLICATVYFYLPIFLSNLLFATLFSETKTPHLDLGANLFGLVFGGFTEYVALITGYQRLTILIAVCYIVSMLLIVRQSKRIYHNDIH